MQDNRKLAQDEVQQALSDSGPENKLASDVNETKLKLKLDLFILPLLASIFFLAVIGQSNIGNAYQAGLAADLSLTLQMFANVNSLFIIGYVVGQLPATLLLRHIGPQRQVCDSNSYNPT